MLHLESPLDTGVKMFREPKESESKTGRRDWHWGVPVCPGRVWSSGLPACWQTCGTVLRDRQTWGAYGKDDERMVREVQDSQHKLSSLLIVSLPVCEKPRARMKFLCFVSSLDWHIKQSGPAQIFKWRFKPLGSSLQECAFHIGWHSYQHVLAK